MANTVEENNKNREETLKTVTPNALEGLRKVKAEKDNTSQRINIKDREGNVLLTFRIRPLSDLDYEKITSNTSTKRKGVEKRNLTAERGEEIYMATVDEDKYIWDSPQVLAEYNTHFPRDVIEDSLASGDKLAIVNAIDNLSGYTTPGEENSTIDIEDELKN